jgi:hypothetical protein
MGLMHMHGKLKFIINAQLNTQIGFKKIKMRTLSKKRHINKEVQTRGHYFDDTAIECWPLQIWLLR